MPAEVIEKIGFGMQRATGKDFLQCGEERGFGRGARGRRLGGGESPGSSGRVRRAARSTLPEANRGSESTS